MNKLTIAIPTYHRAYLLKLLLEDILRQSTLPSSIIVIDGDSQSTEEKALLSTLSTSAKFSISYIPSNYANLPYQRYLGWRRAAKIGADYLLYLDDDLRIGQPDAILNLIKTLESNESYVGVTCQLRMGKMESADIDFNQLASDKSIPDGKLVQFFGTSRKVRPGGITPTGNRVPPVFSSDNPLQETQWLRGGVMLYRMAGIDQTCFSEDLFAIYHIKCGKGEDTFLSRQVLQKGKLIFDSSVTIDHPNLDLPKTYPVDAYHFGYASAYSRRFLNDHYRVTRPPTFTDRVALIRLYAGNNLLNFYRAVRKPARYRFAYAWGYFRGALHGLLQKPTARNLTPDINWWADADIALEKVIEIQ